MVKFSDKIYVHGPKIYFYDDDIWKTFNERLKDPISKSLYDSISIEQNHEKISDRLRFIYFLKTIGDLTLDHPDPMKCLLSKEAIFDEMKDRYLKGMSEKRRPLYSREFDRYIDIRKKINIINGWLKQRTGKNFVKREKISRKDIRYKLLIFEAYPPNLKNPTRLYSDKYKKAAKKLIKKFDEQNLSKVEKHIIKKMDVLEEGLKVDAYNTSKWTINNEFPAHAEHFDLIWKIVQEAREKGVGLFPLPTVRMGMASTDPVTHHIMVKVIPLVCSICNFTVKDLKEGHVVGWKEKLKDKVNKERKHHQVSPKLAKKIEAYIIKSIEEDIENLD